MKAVLKERARLLAVKDKVAEDRGEQIDILEFMLAEERYAIDSTCVSEVIRIKELTPLPCTPAFILGIINVRGEILSVIDIKKFFNLQDKGITNLNRVIIVKYNGIELGILTDEIIENSTIDLDSLQSQITSVTEVPENFIVGVSKDRLIVLDIRQLLSNRKIIINEEDI